MTVHRAKFLIIKPTRCTNSIPDGVIGFFIDIILPAAQDSGVDSASNRNEYQEYFLGLKAADG